MGPVPQKSLPITVGVHSVTNVPTVIAGLMVLVGPGVAASPQEGSGVRSM
jgi:hypothetical protein